MRLLPVLLFLMASVAECLMLSRVLVPQYKLFGEDALLRCDYNLGRDRLYAVKWYKDNEEFFRYVPRFNPPVYTHSVEGVRVDNTRSNDKRVLLRSLTVRSSGGYRCEVSAEAPSFASIMGEGRMTVVYLPKDPPQITGHVRDEYEVGNMLDLNCTSAKSFPPAKLSWYINDSPVHVPPGSISIHPASSAEHSTPQQHEPHQQQQHQQRHHYSFGGIGGPPPLTTSATNLVGTTTTSASSSLASSLMISSLRLQLQLESHHFGPKGTAKVRCVARISPLFWQDGDEKILSGNHGGGHNPRNGQHHRHGRKKTRGEEYGDELVSGEEADENGEEEGGDVERQHAHHNSNSNRGGYHHQQQQHNSNYQQNHQVPYRHHSNSNTNNYRPGGGYHGRENEDGDMAGEDGLEGEEDEEQDEYYGLGLPAFQREALVLVRGSCSSLKPVLITELLVTLILTGLYCYQYHLQALKF